MTEETRKGRQDQQKQLLLRPTHKCAPYTSNVSRRVDRERYRRGGYWTVGEKESTEVSRRRRPARPTVGR